MEALVAVTAFAGALFAAITTGVLVGRLRDDRSGWLLAWTVTTTALCLALGSIAIGHLIGFGPATFRVYQITGAFLAPFWLAIGMVQMLARKTPSKFAAWLTGCAFTVVTTVILLVDPVSQVDKFGTTLPLGDTHWTIIPTALLDVAHALTYLILIGCLILAVLRWRGGDDLDADNMHAGVVLAPTGLALVGVVRFAIPGVFAALVISLMVGAVWYAVARPLAPYDEERDDSDDWEEDPRPASGARPAARRDAPAASYDSGPMPVTQASPSPPSPRRSGLGDLVAEYRAGDHGDVDYAARMQGSEGFPGQQGRHGQPPQGTYGAPVGRAGERGPGEPGRGGPGEQGRFGPGESFGPPGEQGRFTTGDQGRSGPREPAGPGEPRSGPGEQGWFGPGESFGPGEGFGRPDQGYGGPPGAPGGPGAAGGDPGLFGGPATGAFMGQDPLGAGQGQYGAASYPGVPDRDAPYPGPPDRDAPYGHGGYAQDPLSQNGSGALGAQHPGQPGPQNISMPATGALFAGAELQEALNRAEPPAAPGSVRPSPRIYGLLTVFTLIDGAGEAFDRLAEETVEEVRRSEPDTLIFICHAVKSAPLQRIVYEIYRDEVAYTEHQRQPHMERFARERVAHVLAANVIELNLNAAKVVPLPTAYRV